jgi:hypothetical protein
LVPGLSCKRVLRLFQHVADLFHRSSYKGSRAASESVALLIEDNVALSSAITLHYKDIVRPFLLRCDGKTRAFLAEQAPDEQKESGDEEHKCEANHRNKNEPDDGAEWLKISLTATVSRSDEIFRTDGMSIDLQHPPRIFEQNLPRYFLIRRHPPDRRKLLRPAAFFAFTKTIIAIASVE